MSDYQRELDSRVAFIRNVMKRSGAKGLVYGNSGGKDSALTGILCREACENTVGLIMPCQSSRNYGSDMQDGKEVADRFGIETRTVDLSDVKLYALKALENCTKLSPAAAANIAPRLRMMTLYAVAAAENRIVAGTGNRSEGYMGYFTKWGDGAFDFNPIADLTVTEIYEFLRFLGAPDSIITKAPSAGLFDGQTDEEEMGISYKEIDRFLLGGEADEKSLEIIERYHRASEHKRNDPICYKSTPNA